VTWNTTGVIAAGLILAALAGAVHVNIWVLESLLWTAFGHHREIGRPLRS
jgi:hypothetical protein